MNYQIKLNIEFENLNQWREIIILWVDPFQNLTFPINLPLVGAKANVNVFFLFHVRYRKTGQLHILRGMNNTN